MQTKRATGDGQNASVGHETLEEADAVRPSVRPPVRRPPSPSAAALCDSNSGSFPGVVYVAMKAVFMKVSFSSMRVSFDYLLSAELAARMTASRRASHD